MTIKMDHRHRSIRLVDTPQQRQRDGMITSHGDNPWKGLAGLGETIFVGVGERLAHEEAVVALFNLLDCPGVVVSAIALSTLNFNSK